MRYKIIIGVVLFVLGMMIGNFLPVRSVLAQEKPGEPDNWIIQSIGKPGAWACLVNTRTGEAFTLAGTDKQEVKLKVKGH